MIWDKLLKKKSEHNSGVYHYIRKKKKKKLAAFIQFATKNDAYFLKTQITRKRMDSGRRKIVYIMKADDRGIYCCKHGLIEDLILYVVCSIF